MGGLLFTALIVVAAIVWLLKRRGSSGLSIDEDDERRSFVLTLSEGRIVKTKGIVPRTVYNAFCEVAVLTDATGEIRWSEDDGLTFSDELPDGLKQQFRNVFGVARVH